MIVGDAANFLLGGIPGDLHDEFVMDVESADLAQASGLLNEMSENVRTIHVTLSRSVASLEGRWQSDGAATFDSEIWQPLSHGLGVLERECGTAASELARLAVQAEQAHLYKVEELNQEIQTQLYIFAGTSLIGGPELGGVIADAVGGLAARLGGELVGRIVAGVVDAISALLRKVLDAFYDLLKWAAKPVASAMEELTTKVEGVARRLEGDGDGPASAPSGAAGLRSSTTVWEPNKLNHIFGNPRHRLNTVGHALGGEANVMDAAQASLHGPDVPAGGPFEVMRALGGHAVTIRGVVVNGVPKIGTMFVVP